jgi:hypothetical protein
MTSSSKYNSMTFATQPDSKATVEIPLADCKFLDLEIKWLVLKQGEWMWA